MLSQSETVAGGPLDPLEDHARRLLGASRPPPLDLPPRAGWLRSLSFRFFLVLLLTTLAVGALSATIDWLQFRRERARLEQQLVIQAETVALLVDREFDTALGAAHLLAASASLIRSDLTAYQIRLDQVGRWIADAQRDPADPVLVAAFDATGAMIATAGGAQIAGPNPPGIARAIETGQPQILDLFTDDTARRLLVGVAEPVFGQSDTTGPAIGAVAVSVPRERLLNIARTTIRESGTVVTVFDRNLATVARSNGDAVMLGRLPQPAIAEALRARPFGLFDAPNRPEGAAVAAFAHAPVSGFTVAISVPAKTLVRPLLTSLRSTVLIAVFTLLAALLVCVWFSRRITAAFQNGIANAQRAADAERPLASTGLREADRLGELLASAFRDRNAATARALENERQILAITQAAPLVIWSADASGNRDYYNQRWFDLVGTALEHVRGARWMQLIHPDDREPVARRWADSVRTGEPYELEYRLRVNDGSYRWMLSRALAVRAADGRVERWYATCVEIQDIVEAREAAARSREDLERLVSERTSQLRSTETRLAHAARLDALGKLAGGIAHDFNNILQIMSSNARIMLARADQEEAVRKYAGLTIDTVQRGAAITGRLLTFSRQGELHASVFDVGELIGSVIEMLTATLGPGITLRARLAADLPPLQADRSQLETVLVNLATNARDALDGKGEIVFAAQEHADPAARCQRRFLRLSVIDGGCGMTEEVLARAREPFYTTKAFGKGTGLGLAMAHGFAEQSGGTLEIESAPGSGTAVSLLLPVIGAG